MQRVEWLARGIEVIKANQREVLELLTLLLKNSAPPQPDLPSITELIQLPDEDFKRCEERGKATSSSNQCSKNGKFEKFF